MMISVKEYKINKANYPEIKEGIKFQKEFQVGKEMQMNHNTSIIVAKNIKKERKINVSNAETMAK